MREYGDISDNGRDPMLNYFERYQARYEKEMDATPLPYWDGKTFQNCPNYTKDEDSPERFQVTMKVEHFQPEELEVRVSEDGYVTVTGHHKEKSDNHGPVARKFIRKYKLPEDVNRDEVMSKLDSCGNLTVLAPKMPQKVHKIEIITDSEGVKANL